MANLKKVIEARLAKGWETDHIEVRNGMIIAGTNQSSNVSHYSLDGEWIGGVEYTDECDD